MLSTRVLAAALLLSAAAPALADDAVEVCLLRSTETLTAKGKAHIFETELDCGKKPTPAQTALAALVHNAMDTADALELAVKEGYEVEASVWRDSFTGRQILGVATLVKGEGGVVAAPAPAPAADELPEKEEDEADADQADDASAPVEPDL